jgi:hypothetical protein
MNRFSSAVYKIQGNWQDPQVNFDRVFDTSSSKGTIVVQDPNERADSEVPERAQAELQP